MTKPSPYPPTDSAENRVVAIFLHKIDNTRIKADIKTRDKYPNIDGTVEIVDDDNTPLGKLDIQVRKIPNGAHKYSCPSSLVAYSDVSTLPVVLVCIDESNEAIYWRAISSSMPEYKADQDSFTITFDPAVDQVDSTNLYIAKWTELVLDYQERITRYPSLKEKVEDEFGLATVNTSDIISFQQLADALNNLLDTDLIAFKRVLFPGTWKLGVGINQISSSSVSFLLYRIPYGKNSSILSKFEGNPLDLLRDVPHGFLVTEVDMDEMQNADGQGRRFALEFVPKAVKRRLLPIRGKLVAQELLFWFIDRFSFCLGLKRSDVYSLSDVSIAFNRYLPLWYSKAQEHLGLSNKTPSKFEVVVNSIKPEEQELIRSEVEKALSENAPIPFVVVYSKNISFKAISESIEYLRAMGIDQIRRLYIPRSEDLMNGFIWSGYDAEGLKHNIELILNGSIDEYGEFISANKIVLKDSDYLGNEKAFILSFDYQSCAAGHKDFWLTKIVVHNPDGRLKKVTIVDHDVTQELIKNGKKTVELDGYNYKIIEKIQDGWDDLFNETPILDRIYSMLEDDLKLNYDELKASSKWLFAD
jgi:hypothetical protein